MAQRIPTEAADPDGMAARFIARHGIARYRKDYEAGWRASSDPNRESGMDSPSGGTYSDAWEDGYLDMAAGREKWHLLRCTTHEQTC